ncbi:MAG: hypothetical protein PHZ25_00045 [Candidatus Pacebacteria bacterium]|nr:hypothetical protein [Candidatus Paceibacterota bacterium]
MKDKRKFFGKNKNILLIGGSIIIPPFESFFEGKEKGCFTKRNGIKIKNGVGERLWIKGRYPKKPETEVLVVEVLESLMAVDFVKSEKREEFLKKRPLTPFQISNLLNSSRTRNLIQKKEGKNYLFFIFNPDFDLNSGKGGLFVLNVYWFSSENMWIGSLTGEKSTEKRIPGSLVFLGN